MILNFTLPLSTCFTLKFKRNFNNENVFFYELIFFKVKTYHHTNILLLLFTLGLSNSYKKNSPWYWIMTAFWKIAAIKLMRHSSIFHSFYSTRDIILFYQYFTSRFCFKHITSMDTLARLSFHWKWRLSKYFCLNNLFLGGCRRFLAPFQVHLL